MSMHSDGPRPTTRLDERGVPHFKSNALGVCHITNTRARWRATSSLPGDLCVQRTTAKPLEGIRQREAIEKLCATFAAF